MVEGRKQRIVQKKIQPYLTQRREHFDDHWQSFPWIPHLPTFYSCDLVVDGTVDGGDNKEEETREVADIRMKHPTLTFLQKGRDI